MDSNYRHTQISHAYIPSDYCNPFINFHWKGYTNPRPMFLLKSNHNNLHDLLRNMLSVSLYIFALHIYEVSNILFRSIVI